VSGWAQEDRALVLGQLGALRRMGWSVLDGARLVADGLGPGAGRQELLEVVHALERGETPEARGDAFVALLARADAAGAEVLEQGAHAERTAWEARHALRAALSSPLALTLGLAAVWAVVNGAIKAGRMPWPQDVALPGYTFFVVNVLPLLVAVAVFAAAVGGVILLRASRQMTWGAAVPGVSKLMASARLRTYAAAIDVGVAQDAALQLVGARSGSPLPHLERGLDPRGELLGRRLVARIGPAAGARVLADELEEEGRRSLRQFLNWAPVFAVLLFSVGLGSTVGALFLPIFSIAGAIR